jgi:16S rRNA (guanine527-N7)-methyltransferase
MLGQSLSEGAVLAFETYYKFLEEKNQVMNLTAITGEKEVAELHFLDSLALRTFVDFTDARVIDIGSGAGFPGLPLKIAEDTIVLTLLDAQQKRIRFLQELCTKIGCADVTCLHARAEEAAFDDTMREQYDYCVSRAVARLNILSELCLPFVKVGGIFIAMKGVDSDEEIREAKNAVKTLGGKVEKVSDYVIPGTDVTHRAVVIRKVTHTSPGHPRRFAKIQKSPL